MHRSEIIYLISERSGTNGMGDNVSQENKRQVFANTTGVRQSEFYLAAATGLRPEIMFEISTFDYSGEQKLEYNGVEYTIIRTYPIKAERIEIICQGLVNRASS